MDKRSNSIQYFRVLVLQNIQDPRNSMNGLIRQTLQALLDGDPVHRTPTGDQVDFVLGMFRSL